MTQTKENKKLILIDGNAIIHRAYHALPPLTTKTGELVNAVYGFTSTVLSVIEQFHPDYIVASFDLAGPTFRHEKFAAYKATRTKADDALYAQIPRVKEVVRALNIPIYEKAGFEADDVIGTLSKQADENHDDIETIIVTGDMDTLQLVSDKTSVYAMRRGLSDSVLYDKEKVFERYSLSPEQLIEYKGLRGDPSDNIPGVKGIGEKTAISLLVQYKTIDGVYTHIEEIKGANKEKLLRDKAQAYLSKELATIDRNAPTTLDLEQAAVHEYDREKIVQLLSDLNFYSLVKRLPGSDPKLPNKSESTKDTHGVKDFKFETVTPEKMDEFTKELSAQKEIAVSLDVNDSALIGMAFSWKTGRASYIPFSTEINPSLKEVLENNSIAKIGYNLKSAIKILKKYNINLNPSFDVLIGAYVLNPGGKTEFETLILSELGEEVSFEKKKGQLSLVAGDDEEHVKTTCQKADYCLKLKNVLEKAIREISQQQTKAKRTTNTLHSVFEKVEMPLVKILAAMEQNGVKLNPVIFKGISEKLTKRLKNLEKSIHELGKCEFNINSPSQLAEVLFNVLKLPTRDIKKGKTGYSTAAAELEKLRHTHKIIEKIEEYRELFKLKTTYLDTLPLLCDEQSRIHTTFNQAITATGRLSSTEPNLQNIPIKTDLGQLLRTAFVAQEGNVLIGADYSQIDLRVVAHVSGDKKLIEAFRNGEDIHKLTASQVYQVSLSQVTETMRRNAKALNFGIIYGMSAFGFSQSAGIERYEAQKFIDEYMEKFSDVAKYMKETREFARKNGYVETLIGRRRNIPEINSPNFQVANAAQRMAINMPIQGLAADIMKLAMIKVHEHFSSDSDVQMLLQIHDEIILEVPREKSESVAEKVKEIMENVLSLDVPLIVDVKIGENWGEI